MSMDESRGKSEWQFQEKKIFNSVLLSGSKSPINKVLKDIHRDRCNNNNDNIEGRQKLGIWIKQE